MGAVDALFLRLKTRLCVEFDLYRWQRQVSPLGTRKTGTPTRRAVFCNLSSTVATLKAEAIYAHFLAQRGYAVTVILPGRNRIAERIFRAVLIVDFLYLDTYAADLDAKQIVTEAKGILRKAATFEQLLAVAVDEVRVGKNALSWVARQLRVGSIDLNHPAHFSLVEKTLIESIRALRSGQRILADAKPDLALFLERGYTPAGEFFDLCIAAGVNTVQWLSAPQSDKFLFKRYNMTNRAYHPLSLDANSWREIQALNWTGKLDKLMMDHFRDSYQSGAWFNRQKLQENKVVKSRQEIVSQLGLDPSKKNAVVFTHILYDATFFYGESLFVDYATWLTETIREAIDNPNLNWLVKVHPVNVWRSKADGIEMEQLEGTLLRDAFGELPDHVKILPADTDINTYSLFEAIDYGLTVRGTIGMELPCFGIPTITAGSGRYSGAGFTVDPVSQEEYRSVLARLHTIPRLTNHEIELARRYAFGSFFLRSVPVDSFRIDYHADEYQLPLFAQNTYLDDASGDAADMNAIADWMADGREMDLLAWKSVSADIGLHNEPAEEV